MKTTLFKKDAKGAMRFWSCSIEYSLQCLVLESGQVGGETTVKEDWIEEGKASRSIDEQLELRFNSRVKVKKDKGYVETIDEAQSPARNQLGFRMPMLAKKFKDVEVSYPCQIQRKYNGHRCLITMEDGEKIAYSRRGNLIGTVSHLFPYLNLLEDDVVDGELYLHGKTLQEISSFVKRMQPESKNLIFVAYDIITDDPYSIRIDELRMRIKSGGNVEIAPTHVVYSEEQAFEMFRKFRQEKYEGAMLRHGQKGYQDGKRSDSLVKMKEWEDDEFKVVGVTASKDGWGILHCEVPKTRKIFTVSAPGTISEKRHVLENIELFVGKYVTVEFAEYTEYGIPFHPNAVCWRDKENE